MGLLVIGVIVVVVLVGQRGTLTMNATIHPTACTTPGCTNPATTTLPYYVPGDEHDHACTACHAAYLEALTARDDD
ncbi:hypothetical protein [Nocardia cyriacigeorgica]|uniref:hypothetical protein n=2 Tax=Nocardia cyriacigeorgica TaxID=135487 RepID=UPI0002E44A5F|nr:hypothetical protein [Nocardia cyriacigeorgica]